jgi:5'-3' exonuclease
MDSTAFLKLLQEPKKKPAQPIYILVDGSYFCFHRYHSLLSWWKNTTGGNTEQQEELDPMFLDKFRKTFVETLQQIRNNLHINKTAEITMMVGKDCKRNDIWRMQHFPQYKQNRDKDRHKHISNIFQLVWNESLFQKGGCVKTLYHPCLEADDCIAITAKKILLEKPSAFVYIITSDKDYLQLAGSRVAVYDLSFRNISESKTSHGCSETDLFCKIVMGDSSDNIPSVLKSCGPAMAMKCYQNREFFHARIQKEQAEEKYKLNSLLIDFNNIPVPLVDEFLLTFEEEKRVTYL